MKTIYNYNYETNTILHRERTITFSKERYDFIITVECDSIKKEFSKIEPWDLYMEVEKILVGINQARGFRMEKISKKERENLKYFLNLVQIKI